MKIQLYPLFFTKLFVVGLPILLIIEIIGPYSIYMTFIMFFITVILVVYTHFTVSSSKEESLLARTICMILFFHFLKIIINLY